MVREVMGKNRSYHGLSCCWLFLTHSLMTAPYSSDQSQRECVKTVLESTYFLQYLIEIVISITKVFMYLPLQINVRALFKKAKAQLIILYIEIIMKNFLYFNQNEKSDIRGDSPVSDT